MKNNVANTIFLAAFDVSGIQEFIFATNRLKENAGASVLVTDILRNELPIALKNLEQDNIHRKAIVDWGNANNNRISPLSWIDNDNEICAEIIYIGGGNAIVAYKDRDSYNSTRKYLAESLIKKCPYLTISSCIKEVPLIDFPKQRGELLADLAKKKRGMLRNQIISTFPIVEQDTAFGYSITDIDERGENITSIQKDKRMAFKKDLSNKNSIYQTTLPAGFSYAIEMPHMVSDINSFVAVVHIDGNSMGNLFHQTIDSMSTEFGKAITEMRNLSVEIATTYQKVFRKIMNQYSKCVTISANTDSGEKIIPLRLVLMDGDDVTFICNASHGIPLAAAFLRELMRETKGKFTACAGICLAHSHFPFRISYETAEACCASAKESWYQDHTKPAGFLDFQLLRGASERELVTIREGIENKKSLLLTRPYKVVDGTDRKEKESFECFHNQLLRLPYKNKEVKGAWPRSRLKKLHEFYLKEHEDLEALKMEYKSRGYCVDELAGGADRSLFDALEVMDYYDRDLFEKLCEFKSGDTMETGGGKSV